MKRQSTDTNTKLNVEITRQFSGGHHKITSKITNYPETVKLDFSKKVVRTK